VLLGSRFVLADVLKLGGISLALVVIEISLSLLLMHALGRSFKLTPKLTSLLAVGSSICGVSAIIAAKGPSMPMTKTQPLPSPPSWLSVRSPCLHSR